jgi:hypothetical protein
MNSSLTAIPPVHQHGNINRMDVTVMVDRTISTVTTLKALPAHWSPVGRPYIGRFGQMWVINLSLASVMAEYNL